MILPVVKRSSFSCEHHQFLVTIFFFLHSLYEFFARHQCTYSLVLSQTAVAVIVKVADCTLLQLGQVEKTVFVVFFAGERARTKIMKICEAFGANRYAFPEDPNRQWQMKTEVLFT